MLSEGAAVVRREVRKDGPTTAVRRRVERHEVTIAIRLGESNP